MQSPSPADPRMRDTRRIMQSSRCPRSQRWHTHTHSLPLTDNATIAKHCSVPRRHTCSLFSLLHSPINSGMRCIFPPHPRQGLLSLPPPFSRCQSLSSLTNQQVGRKRRGKVSETSSRNNVGRGSEGEIKRGKRRERSDDDEKQQRRRRRQQLSKHHHHDTHRIIPISCLSPHNIQFIVVPHSFHRHIQQISLRPHADFSVEKAQKWQNHAVCVPRLCRHVPGVWGRRTGSCIMRMAIVRGVRDQGIRRSSGRVRASGSNSDVTGHQTLTDLSFWVKSASCDSWSRCWSGIERRKVVVTPVLP